MYDKVNNMDILKRIVFVILFVMVLFTSSSNGQSKVVLLPTDSLLKWFENNPPLDVWNKIYAWKKGTLYRTQYDYKAYYNEPRLKPYLMEWLDRDLYYQNDLKKTRNDFEPKTKDDSAYMAYKIRGFIKNRKSNVNLDSALNSPDLYIIYKDSVIDKIVENEIKRMNKFGKPFPPSHAIYFHMRLAYPESYQQIRTFWEATGKKIEKNDYFIPLVRMGDPEARKLYDKLVDEIVEKNGNTPYFSMVKSNTYTNLRGSHGAAKLMEMLSVDMEIALSEGPSFPVNCNFIKSLVSDIFYYKIEIDSSVKFREACETRFEHVDKIKEATQRLIETYKVQEYYWMSNMPFYEK
ncbi:MAG: hypothetical protein L3J06_04185 [Cyclobacteriaceae bacterium]|nr:hypothetical protein [Cyclobacteriaceae bacterium]